MSRPVSIDRHPRRAERQEEDRREDRHGGRPHAARARATGQRRPRASSVGTTNKLTGVPRLPKTCARGRSDRAGGGRAMGATFSSWRRRRPSEGDGGFETLNPRDAAMALDEDTRLFHRALRKHDRRLDKRARAARRTLAWARGDPGAPAPSSPTLRARGPSVASVGKRGGGLGEFGLDRRDGPEGARRTTRCPATRAGRRARAGAAPRPAREYDIIRAECAKKMELAERNRARARRAASRRRAGEKEDESPFAGKRADERRSERGKEAPFSDRRRSRRGRASSRPPPPPGFEPPTSPSPRTSDPTRRLAGLNPRPRSVRPPSYRRRQSPIAVCAPGTSR